MIDRLNPLITAERFHGANGSLCCSKGKPEKRLGGKALNGLKRKGRRRGDSVGDPGRRALLPLRTIYPRNDESGEARRRRCDNDVPTVGEAEGNRSWGEKI